jgi:glucose/arabinose dehydrogenase
MKAIRVVPALLGSGLLAVCLAIVPARAGGGSLPAVELQLIATAADQVVHIANSGVAGDDRLFIVRKRGIVQIIDGGSIVATPFLDIDSLVVNPGGGGDERGLLSIAFHPDYDSNGYFFVEYIDNASDTVIARYQVSGDPDVADAGSALLILGIDQPATNHNGGQLQFGPDGYLYAAMGDGGGGCDSAGAGCNAQKTDSLLGSLLRIDVDGDDFPGDPNRNYAVPGDNPFVGNAAFAPEIWSYGLRNPWRFSFDRATGDLWLGDVGQSGTSRREEVNFQAAGVGGQNYGWPVAEGDQCDPGTCALGSCPLPLPTCGSLTYPLYQYTGGGSCAVTGGFVYRGSAIAGLAGRYVFSDYCSGDIVALDPGNPTDDPVIEDAGFELTSFGEDVDGELYVAVGDDIYKLVDAGIPTAGADQRLDGLGEAVDAQVEHREDALDQPHGLVAFQSEARLRVQPDHALEVVAMRCSQSMPGVGDSARVDVAVRLEQLGRVHRGVADDHHLPALSRRRSRSAVGIASRGQAGVAVA